MLIETSAVPQELACQLLPQLRVAFPAFMLTKREQLSSGMLLTQIEEAREAKKTT
jgi:hypothetical protein